MYKLTVTAYDCGKNRASEDVLVKISVKPTCKPSWQGNNAVLYTLSHSHTLTGYIFIFRVLKHTFSKLLCIFMILFFFFLIFYLLGFSKRIEYEPGTGSLGLFPSMHLETCDEPITSIQASVELETNHIGKGCDRDTYSEKSLHTLCGI